MVLGAGRAEGMCRVMELSLDFGWVSGSVEARLLFWLENFR